MIDVCIIEDDKDIREALTLLLDGSPGFRCTRAFAGCRDAFRSLAALQPDVLLLDIELPGITGIEGLPQLRKLVPEMDIIMLTVHDEDRLIFDSLCAGASGYLLKTTPPLKLLAAIAEVRRGGAPMSASVARRVISSFKSDTRDTALTPRETEILSHLCEGKSYKMIADALFITTGTVHCHIKRIYKKLQVHSNAEAVATALRDRLV